MSNIDKTPSEVVDEFLGLYQRVMKFLEKVLPKGNSVRIKTDSYKKLPISPDELECVLRAMERIISRSQWDALKPKVKEICHIQEWKKKGLFDFIEDAERELKGVRLLYEFCDSISFACLDKASISWVCHSFTSLRESLEYPAYTPPPRAENPKQQKANTKTTLWTYSPKGNREAYNAKLEAVLQLAVEFGVFVKEADHNAYKAGSASQEVIACFIAESAKILGLTTKRGNTRWQIWINSIDGLPEDHIRKKAKKDLSLSDISVVTLGRIRSRLNDLKHSK